MNETLAPYIRPLSSSVRRASRTPQTPRAKRDSSGAGPAVDPRVQGPLCADLSDSRRASGLGAEAEDGRRFRTRRPPTLPKTAPASSFD